MIAIVAALSICAQHGVTARIALSVGTARSLLAGTVADATAVSIKAVIANSGEVAGVVSGMTWTITLPPGVLDDGGTPVQIVATDAAGNQRSPGSSHQAP